MIARDKQYSRATTQMPTTVTLPSTFRRDRFSTEATAKTAEPSVVKRLTVVNDQHQHTQIPGVDNSQHRETLRRLRRQMQRCRDSALRDGRAHWVNVKRRDGKAKSRFRWNQKPSKTYLQVMAQLRKVERKRIKTLQAEEHRITTKIGRDHALVAVEDTAIGNMTRSAKDTLENPG